MAVLRKIRIGTDITLGITVMASGHAVDWNSQDIKHVYAFSDIQGQPVAEMSYEQRGSTLRCVFHAEDQNYVGAYRVIIEFNDGSAFSSTLDMPAFEIVRTSEEADIDTGEVVLDIDGSMRFYSLAEVIAKLEGLHTEVKAAASAAREASDNANTAAKKANDAAALANSNASKAEASNKVINDNERKRIAQETARESAEAERKRAELERQKGDESIAIKEAVRVRNEEVRETNEQTRESNELERRNAESARDRAETQRASSETTRISDETSRQAAENERVAAETSRQEAETARVNVESERVTEFARLKKESEEATKAASAVSDVVAGHTKKITKIEQLLQEGYQFMGVATTDTNPSTPDQKVFYIANGKGTYANFGGLIVDEDEVVLLIYDDAWKKLSSGIASNAKLIEINNEISYTLKSFHDNKGSFWDIGENTSIGEFPDAYPDKTTLCVDKIYVTKGQKFLLTTEGGNSARAYAFTDNDNTIIERAEAMTNFNNQIIVAPADGFLYVNDVMITGMQFILIKFGLANDVENLNSKIEAAENYRKYTSKTADGSGDGYVYPYQSVGANVQFGTFDKHSIYQLKAGEQVKVNLISGGTYGFSLCDTNDKILEQYRNDIQQSFVTKKYGFATTLYVSTSKVSGVFLISDMKISDQVRQNEEDIKELKENPIPNYWNDKNIWWCGTSIPAGSDETLGSEATIAGNYPKQVGINLSAIVSNESVGGSMCRANVRTGNYVGAVYANITSALSMTNAEIENFITNYATIKDSLASGAPSEMSSGDKERMRAASFETKLIPYLNGTKTMPDLFVIDHGHNDWKYELSDGKSDIVLEPTIENIKSGELAEDTFMTANNNANLEKFFGSLSDIPLAKKDAFIASVNRNCFIGSVNFIITLILRYNPHARFVIISNYEYKNGDNPAYAPLILSQKSISESWAFPLCEVYKYLGFSNHVIPNSKEWFNTTYPDVTKVTADITCFRAYNPDFVHPHSDITGDANSIYAGVISEFIKTCR